MDYKLFKASYVDRKTGQKRESETYHIRFRDHLNRRQTLASSARERDAHTLAAHVGGLVQCRRSGESLPVKVQRWLEVVPNHLRDRLTEMDLIDNRMVDAAVTLAQHLDGRYGADGQLIEPGFKQALEARGNTANHVKTTTDRARRILNGCGFVFWKDIAGPGAATSVEVFLGKLRSDGDITGKTLNYYIRDMRSFCHWMSPAKTGKAPAMALASLAAVKNAEADSEGRRPLSIDEMKLLLAAAAEGDVIQGMTGQERAILYRFAFETGMRPGQIRALTVKDFALDGDTPTVTTQAKYVKRRRVHTQSLRPALATDLLKLFASKMPSAPAIKMPSKYHLADMLRKDLATARATWIGQAKTDEAREERQRSEFLAEKNHANEIAVFYSMRHGHGTALADAGVPEKDIAASMHHASRKTTERYIHADRTSVRRAIASMPDLSYPEAQVMTGTDAAVVVTSSEDCLRNACATATPCVASGGQIAGSTVDSVSLDSEPKAANYAELGPNRDNGLLAELADAMDSKSISQKEYRFDSDRGHLL